MIVNNVVYKHYPKIREKDIGSNTSNKFVDTFQLSNLHLGKMGGDYDGDMVSIKGIYSDEANIELDKHMNKKINYINFGVNPVMEVAKEMILSLYCVTMTLSQDKGKLGKPEF